MISKSPLPRFSGSTTRFIPLMLVGLVVSVFATAIKADFVWDDKVLLLANPRFQPPTFASIIYYCAHPFWNLYQPVTCCVWALLARLDYVVTPDESGSHFDPYVFHLACMLIHAGCVVGVYRLLRLLVCGAWPAAMGAALFAVHPIQVEAVAFISALNNPLYAVLGIFAITDYLLATSPDSDPSRRRWYWVRGTILFILAMLAKPTAVVVPAMAMVLDGAHHRRPGAAVIRSAIPWFVLAAPCIIWTKINQSGTVFGASVPFFFHPLIAMDSISMQFFHIVAPFSLAIDYGRTPGYLFSHPAALISGLLTIALLITAWLCRRSAAIVSAAIAIFILALLPNSGIVSFDFQQYSTVADRYAYLSMLGVSLLFAWMVGRVDWRISMLTASVVLLVCVTVSEFQIRIWHDDETLYRRTIAANSGSWMARSNLAVVIADGSPAEAINLCRGAIALNPNVAVAHNNLASLLIDSAPDEAIVQCRAALAIDPNCAAAASNLGSALNRKGDRALALQAFARACELEPQNQRYLADYKRAMDAQGAIPASGPGR